MAQMTKRALAAALKELLKQKPLDKITVTDITEACEVNRQTFYYHFQDIYDLIEWIYTNDATKAIDNKKTYATWQEGFLGIFQYVLDNRALILNTYHSLQREFLERFLYNETYLLLYGVVEEVAQGLFVRDEEKAFIADFYKYAFVGVVLDWIDHGMKGDTAELVSHVSTVMEDNILTALERFQKRRFK